MTSRSRGRLGYFALWTLLGLVFATQLYLAEQRLSPHPSTWWQALRSELPDWYLWGLLALIVRALARRFHPLRREPHPRLPASRARDGDSGRAAWQRAVPLPAETGGQLRGVLPLEPADLLGDRRAGARPGLCP